MPAAFAISPVVDLIDVPRRIALSGLPAGAEVTIAAETLRDGHVWRAQAVFAAAATTERDRKYDCCEASHQCIGTASTACTACANSWTSQIGAHTGRG